MKADKYNKPAAWNNTYPENLINFELLKKFPAFYGPPNIYYHVQMVSSLVPILDLV